MHASGRVYRCLLWLYPARFREEYGVAMERQFFDEYRETDGPFDRARLWVQTIVDAAVSVPQQVALELSADIKQAVRAYSRRSFSMVLAVAALGLAAGVAIGVFSVLNALLLKSLPFSSPDELVELRSAPVTALAGRAAFNEHYRNSAYVQAATTFSSSEMNFGGPAAMRVRATETSASFFRVLGVQPYIGRTFDSDEDVLGHDEIAVIGYGLWQQVFAGDPQAIGRSIQVNGKPLTVIGVAPPRFDYPVKTAIWMPTVFDIEKIPKRGAFLVQTIGRLRPGLTLAGAEGIFETEVQRADPKALQTADTRLRPRLVALQEELSGPISRQRWVLTAVAVLLLLAACANVAQLILSRATERGQELAIRAALGASRARLLQQLITEAILFTGISTALGLFVGKWICAIAPAVAPPQVGTQKYTILDWRVLGFAACLAVVLGAVLGICSSLMTEGLQPSAKAMRSSRSTPNVGTRQVRSGLIVLQAAITMCLITSSFALSRAFVTLLHTDLGFRPSNVATMNVSIQGTRDDHGGEWSYYADALNRLRALPEVEAAGGVSHLPLADNAYMAGLFKLDSGQTVQRVVMNAVTPGYFRAMGMEFLNGGDFVEPISGHVEPRVIVNAAFAEDAGLGRGVVGRKMTVPWTKTPYDVQGLVATTHLTVPQTAGVPQVYFAIQEEPGPAITLVAKVRGDAQRELAKCRAAVRGADPEVPIYDVKTLNERLADVLAQPRFYAAATDLLSLMTVLLAIVGIYGSTAYSMAQRKHEMGVRMALGASSRRIRGAMTWASAAPLLVGSALGIVFAVFAGGYLESVLTAVTRPTVGACLCLAAALVFVGVVTAWRATSSVRSIDPIDALRAE